MSLSGRLRSTARAAIVRGDIPRVVIEGACGVALAAVVEGACEDPVETICAVDDACAEENACKVDGACVGAVDGACAVDAD